MNKKIIITVIAALLAVAAGAGIVISKNKPVPKDKTGMVNQGENIEREDDEPEIIDDIDDIDDEEDDRDDIDDDDDEKPLPHPDNKNRQENIKDDPASRDPTKETVKNKKISKVKKMYIGTWKEIGQKDSAGNMILERRFDKIEIRKNGRYKITLLNEDGGITEETGKWSVNKKKKLDLSGDIYGIDDDGDLVYDTGERTGKGFKLFIAYKKAK